MRRNGDPSPLPSRAEKALNHFEEHCRQGAEKARRKGVSEALLKPAGNSEHALEAYREVGYHLLTFCCRPATVRPCRGFESPWRRSVRDAAGVPLCRPLHQHPLPVGPRAGEGHGPPSGIAPPDVDFDSREKPARRTTQ